MEKMSNDDILHYQNAIDVLIGKGAIVTCNSTKGEFLSTYFLTEKPNGEKRFILNLKKLNKFLFPPHFKLEDRKTVSRIIFKGAFMASLDLQDAFFLIPVAKQYRKYLRFQFKGQLYEFCCVPFGLCTAPYVFTKLLKPVTEYLRSRSLLSVIYLDDFLLISKSKEKCSKNVRITIDVLENLGFIVNKEKSTLEPSKQIKFLGFNWNSKKMSLKLTKDKKEKILLRAQKFDNKSFKIRELAEFVGTLVAACPAVKYGLLYTKNLERRKYLALAENKENYDKRMTLDSSALSDIHWWIKNTPSASNSIGIKHFDIEIFSDASLSGWGVVCNGENVHGWWNTENSKHHINYLELLAAFYGLKCFVKNLRSREILLRIDNTTAIAYINRMGSIQFPKLSNLCKEIWTWCEERHLWIFASYISSSENIDADTESRILPTETEWEIASWAFNEINNKFGPFDIDLFASCANNKCKKFISWKQDPDSLAVDAFTIVWTNFKFYAFPPCSIVLKVLQKIIADKAEGVVVVPYWPTQSWFPLFKSLTIGDLMILGPENNLLSSFSRKHPLADKLSLAVATLSGKRF